MKKVLIVSILAMVFLLNAFAVGCRRSDSVGSVNLLKIRQITTKLRIGNIYRPNGFIPIFENGKLKFIAGGSKHEKIAGYDDLSAYTSDGKIAWTLDATFSVNNPRPYEGKSAKKNDWDFLPDGVVNIGDVTDDGVDDLYVTKGFPTHVGIVSGADGRLIVQSMVETQYLKENNRNWPLHFPAVVFDFDNDGVKDLRFVFSRGGEYKSITLSGKHLGQIDEQEFQFDGRASGLAIDRWQDETGDGVDEFVVFDRRSREQESDQLIVVDGKNLQLVRRLAKMGIEKMSASKIFVVLGDIDSDGIDDIGMTSWKGARGNDDNGVLTAFSGKDGSEIWYVGGEELGGPEQELLTFSKNKPATSNLYYANQLGKSISLVADQNGDGVREILVPLTLSNDDAQQRTLVLISGADGSVIKKKTLDRAHVMGDVIPLIHPDAAGESPTFGMYGSRDRKNGGLIKFSL